MLLNSLHRIGAIMGAEERGEINVFNIRAKTKQFLGEKISIDSLSVHSGKRSDRITGLITRRGC